MAKDVNTPNKVKPETESSQTVGIPDANTLLFDFLTKNNISLDVETLDSNVPYLGERGFALVDKPILIIKAKYKNN